MFHKCKTQFTLYKSSFACESPWICVSFESSLAALSSHPDHLYSLANQIYAFQSTKHNHVRTGLPGCYIISFHSQEFKAASENLGSDLLPHCPIRQ